MGIFAFFAGKGFTMAKKNRDNGFIFVEIPPDEVNHPSHYTAYDGIEVIQITEQLNFNRGNAVKYILRAGLKESSNEITDLEKARWYITREIERLKPKPPTVMFVDGEE
jgi:hypothetical protein